MNQIETEPTTFRQRLADVPKGDFGSAALIGLGAGLAATAFHYLADRLGEVLYTWAETNSAPMRLPLVVLVPTIGLFFVGSVLQRFPGSRRGGVREVWDALSRHGGMIPWSRAVNVVLSGLVLAFGGSVGPEGPMVQMGALVGSKVGQKMISARESLPRLVRAGAAAGIAAAFQSPAGGILLTLEVFGARLDAELAVIGVAAVVGYLTRTALLGRQYPFELSHVPAAVPLAAIFVVAPLMGIAGALAGHLFIKMFGAAMNVLPPRLPLSVRVAIGGFLVGCIGIFFPQVMSAGYPVVEQALGGRLEVKLLLALFLLKMLATLVTFGSGAVGGLFAPTLVIGAMFGGFFGFGIHQVFPAAVPHPEVMVLLGMVVMFGSIVKGHWSGLLLVADMSGSYHAILLPGIIAGGISFVLSWSLHDKSIFELPLAASRGDPNTAA